ncbi:MAG: DNA polymerase-like protein [Rhodospirillales bacterium]|nr:DNA polymerase-like protein [Rhodospirillales bacterium]
MTAGSEVVEDYASIGLSLRRHPVDFLRGELRHRRFAPLEALQTARDGLWLSVAGLVLVRQKPGSAKGVMFLTIEDETGHANLVIWPKLFDQQRRLILTAGMLGCHGRVQREGEVIHLIAETLTDLTPLLDQVGDGEMALPLPHNRGDEARHGGSADAREEKARHTSAWGARARDLFIPDGYLHSSPRQTGRPAGGIHRCTGDRPEPTIRIKTRDFR